MTRKLLNRLDPTRQLPQPMRAYLALPNRLVRIWLVATGMLLAALMLTAEPVRSAGGGQEPAPPEVPATAPEAETTGAVREAARNQDLPAAAEPLQLALAGDIDAQLPDGSVIAVSGDTAFSLKREGDRVILMGSGPAPLVLRGNGEELRVENAGGGPVYRLTIKEGDQAKIFGAADDYRYRLKCEAEEDADACKLYDPAGTKLYRVKIKGDSFNVYGAGTDRLAKGKLKKGVYVVRDESERTVLTLRGVGSLREAALLALPVEPAIRALLWRHAGR